MPQICTLRAYISKIMLLITFSNKSESNFHHSLHEIIALTTGTSTNVSEIETLFIYVNYN